MLVKRSNKNKRKKGSRKENWNQIEKPIAKAPPHYIAQENRTWHIRGVVTGAGVNATAFITIAQLAAFLGVIATSATTCNFLIDQFKFRRIAVWAPVATAGTPVQVSLKFVDDPAGTQTSGPPKTTESISSNLDEYAYACLEPPKGVKGFTSYFSQWQDSSATAAFLNVTWPLGSIVDIFYNWFLDDAGFASAGPTIAGATAGLLYHKNIVLGGSTLTAVLPLNTI
jgi:hypothetical protein